MNILVPKAIEMGLKMTDTPSKKVIYIISIINSKINLKIGGLGRIYNFANISNQKANVKDKNSSRSGKIIYEKIRN